MDAKLLAVFDVLSDKIDKVAADKGLNGKDGKDGRDGKDGSKGKDGKPGAKGKDGKDGRPGKDGKDGKDGQDGVSVVSVEVDFDNHLVTTLSNGEVIDAGSIEDISAASGDTYNVGVRAGGTSRTWIDYATGFSSDPTLLETTAEGDVYEYQYENATLYRLIGATEDSFYRQFVSPTLSDLVVTKSIII